MGSVRQVALVAAAVALTGCAATDRLSAGYLGTRRAVGLDPAAARPVTQVLLLMQRRLEALPVGPDRPDERQPGLPGQVFLRAADGMPTDAGGDLTLTVTDDTPRPLGQPPRTAEKWHFTRDVLALLKQKDERLGDCYVLFLPWPAEWRDVTRVTIRGQYQAAGQTALFAKDVPVALDTGPQAGPIEWQKAERYAVPPFSGREAVPGPPPVTQRDPIPLPQRGVHPGVAPPPDLPVLPPPAPGGVLLPPSATPGGLPQTIVVPRG
jgi:hypothetical protein